MLDWLFINYDFVLPGLPTLSYVLLFGHLGNWHVSSLTLSFPINLFNLTLLLVVFSLYRGFEAFGIYFFKKINKIILKTSRRFVLLYLCKPIFS